ncbi:MAG TPA: hypothetical protein VLZ89_00650 [Anaerolineales bacterium]|nr:hypothetical protein [Anaerolineales bacterium]
MKQVLSTAGDIPLLTGGLAMALFSMEDLKGMSKYSYKYATKLAVRSAGKPDHSLSMAPAAGSSSSE